MLTIVFGQVSQNVEDIFRRWNDDSSVEEDEGEGQHLTTAHCLDDLIGPLSDDDDDDDDDDHHGDDDDDNHNDGDDDDVVVVD